MIEAVEALILDLLEWLAGQERTYAEVMDAGARRAHSFQSGRTRMIAA